MKKLQFKTDINAPIAKVYNTMLGLDDKITYEAWTAAFNPTSTYEGSWEKGAKILFIGIDEKGEKSGMVCEIVENMPNKFVSIRSYGVLQGGVEITEGEEVEKWAGGLENYSFEDTHSITTVTVDIDVTKEYLDYFNETYPKALGKLKELCEK